MQYIIYIPFGYTNSLSSLPSPMGIDNYRYNYCMYNPINYFLCISESLYTINKKLTNLINRVYDNRYEMLRSIN